MLVLFVLVVLVTPGDVWISRWHCVGHHSSSVLHTPPQCFNTIMLWEISCLKSIGGVTNFAAYSITVMLNGFPSEVDGDRFTKHFYTLEVSACWMSAEINGQIRPVQSTLDILFLGSEIFELTFLRSVEPKMGAAAKLGSAFCIRHWASNPASTFVIADIWIKC